MASRLDREADTGVNRRDTDGVSVAQVAADIIEAIGWCPDAG